mmetsp:Transcript_5154/g.16018  ORF Transcript_5154/g.16018 Transcript_5154/m.16018 type:complete len:195 (+) Transcript_5154:171-755(+)
MRLLIAFLVGATGFAPPATTRRRLRADATTSSGIEYEDIQVGSGPSPNKGDFVSVTYETRLKGRVIDAQGGGSRTAMSVGVAGAGDKPWAQFAVGKGLVIPGWDETIQTMQPGGRRKVKLPAALAYGDAGSPDGVVPPGSDLEFTIELVSVDSQAGLIGGLGGIFGLLAAAITANGLALTFTGHELREYLAGTV